MIKKDYKTPNGSNSLYHTIKKVSSTLSTGYLQIELYSYPTKEILETNSIPMWVSYIDIPIIDIVGPILESLENWLITDPDSILFEGTIE